MKKFIVITITFLVLVGCGSPSVNTTEGVRSVDLDIEAVENQSDPVLRFPIDTVDLSYKRFGEYFQDRFSGYHLGDDFEVADLSQKTPVFAIAPGVVSHVSWVSGYGGVIRIQHDIDDQIVTAIYGHVNIDSVTVTAGDRVERGDELAVLGSDKSRQTDGERIHLHFALYPGTEDRLAGYARDVDELARWINPYQFFLDQGLTYKIGGWKSYSTAEEPSGRKLFPIDFAFPAHFDVEYIPQIQSLNVFDARGKGTARERSQVLIRYFDAADFLTLNTVDIFETQETVVGGESYGGTIETYTARAYDIAKKSGVTDFSFQPRWRNERHVVTDFREKEGFTRYYVVAKNPALDQSVYEEILRTMRILP